MRVAVPKLRSLPTVQKVERTPNCFGRSSSCIPKHISTLSTKLTVQTTIHCRGFASGEQDEISDILESENVQIIKPSGGFVQESLDVKQFLSLSAKHPIVDVRSPSEFQQGHIPNAYNLPLFTDEERKLIGTIYKKQGKKPAIMQGLKIVGPKMHDMVETANHILDNWSKNKEPTDKILVHCWRGGMRSASVAWLLQFCGSKAITLQGGYKAFRNYARNIFELEKRTIIRLGGLTGTGKTLTLNALKQLNEQVIDLERIAHHKGSVFGRVDTKPLPTQEQFENDLAMEWMQTSPSARLWLENESQRIGNTAIPDLLWNLMKQSKMVSLDIPKEQRIQFLVKDYAHVDKRDIIENINRIQKKLGGLHSKMALEFTEKGQLEDLCRLLLDHYYDKLYLRSNVEEVILVKAEDVNHVENAKAILRAVPS